MKTFRRSVSVMLVATLALMSACAVPVTQPPPAAAPASPPVVKQLETLALLAVAQPTVAPAAAPAVVPAAPALPTTVSPPPKPAEPQPLIAPDQMNFEGKVDIGGRSLYLACYGKGEPTIIVDDIMGRNGSNFLGLYQPELSLVSRVCFVSRPNTIDSQSDPVKELRTSKDFVADLRAVLHKAGLKPPYVLAGGEFGAMNMTLFAAQYPREAVGLLLVQPWRPGTASAFLDLVPAASATSEKAKQFRAFWERMLVGKYKDPSIELDTRVDILASEKLLRDVKTLGDLPVVVIKGAIQTWSLAPDPAIAARMGKIYEDGLGFYARLSSKVEIIEGRFGDKAPFLAATQKLADAARAQKANEQAAAPKTAPTAAPARQPTPEVIASKLPVPTDATFFEGKVGIGGRSLFLTCQGKGSPTIVFDAALIARGRYLFNSLNIAFPEDVRVCVYDRPNVYGGESDKAAGLRSSQEVLNDFGALLTKAGLKPPYVLIGQSFGGMNMTLFAAQHQSDVAGLILLDPVPPGTFEEWMRLLKTEAHAGETRVICAGPTDYAYCPMTDLSHASDENIDVAGVSAALNEIKTLGNTPVVLVTSQRPLDGGWAWVSDSAFKAKLVEAWKTRRAFYTQIAPNAQVIDVDEAHLLNGDESNGAASKALAKMVERARGLPTPVR